jgi:hypothetical protein
MTTGYPDYEGNKSSVYSVEEWSVIEGVEKNFVLTAADKGFEETATSAYAVPAGKTLYISGMSLVVRASAAADADNNQMGAATLDTDGGNLALIGGNGGVPIVFKRPVVAPGDQDFNYTVTCYANHDCDMVLTLWGWEE